MYLLDYHIHTKLSCDGHSAATEMCGAAVKAGLSEIALTDHYDFGFDPVFWSFEANLPRMRDSARLAARERREELTVRFGLELGGALREPEAAARLLDGYAFDFVIGSVHSLRDSYDFYYYDYAQVDPHALFGDYLDELYELAGTDFYDVLGHLTYPYRYIKRCLGDAFDIGRYEERFRAILRRVAERGKGIEINTSGLRQGMGCTMPEIGMAAVFRELGGEILTVGSDAHYPEHVGADVREMTQALYDLGWRHLASFEERRPVMRSIG